MFIWDVIRVPLRIISDWALQRYSIEVKEESVYGWVVYRKDIFQKTFFLESSAYVFAFNLIEQIRND